MVDLDRGSLLCDFTMTQAACSTCCDHKSQGYNRVSNTSQVYRVGCSHLPGVYTGCPHLPGVQGVNTSKGYRVSTPPGGTGCPHPPGVQGVHMHIPGVGVCTTQTPGRCVYEHKLLVPMDCIAIGYMYSYLIMVWPINKQMFTCSAF